MRFPLVLAAIVLTFFCWGAYGPVLHLGQVGLGAPMQPSSLRPFICVGMAYFLIAVVVPIMILRTKGEKGLWTLSGLIWSLAAGAAGAIGALGIILAFKFRGSPVYVMPLVFGCAPVANTFVTMAMARTFKEASAIFYLGVLIVALGAAGVMWFKPTAKNIEVINHSDGKLTIVYDDVAHAHKNEWGPITLQELETKEEFATAFKLWKRSQPLEPFQKLMVGLSIALTAVCWGAYGPILHKGQMKMAGSRMRPFLCVGLSYFAIAVVVPLILMPGFPEPGGWNFSGTLWSLAGGAVGAVGALGIIMAFNFGGKPIFVMPLVFGCAPVVNTVITVSEEGTALLLSSWFYASLVLVICGAVTVLVFAPKAPHKPTGDPKKPTPDQGGDRKQPLPTH